MTENKTKKSHWPFLLRVLAVVLAAAMHASLLMPSVTGFLSRVQEKEQDFAESFKQNDAFTHKDGEENEQGFAEGFERYNSLADLAIMEEKYEEAAEFLEKALDMAEGTEDEELAKLCLKTASVYVICGDKERAKVLLDRTLELNEASLEALLLKAQLALEEGDSLKATEELENYVQLDPENLNIRLSLAQLYENQGQYKKAMEQYKFLYEKQETDESHHLNALRCSFLSGNYQEALADFDSYLEKTEETSSFYPVALFLRSACYMQLGSLDEAEEGFRQAIEHGYDEGACMEQIMLCSFEQGEYQQTVEYGLELLETEAMLNTPELMYQQLGASLMMLERYEEAVKYLDEAEKLKLELIGNAYYRGVSLLALHRYEEAVKDFDTSIEQGFLTQFCYYNRGVCYVQLLEYEKAASDMEMTLTSGQDAGLIEAAQEIIRQIEEYNENNK